MMINNILFFISTCLLSALPIISMDSSTSSMDIFEINKKCTIKCRHHEGYIKNTGLSNSVRTDVLGDDDKFFWEFEGYYDNCTIKSAFKDLGKTLYLSKDDNRSITDDKFFIWKLAFSGNYDESSGTPFFNLISSNEENYKISGRSKKKNSVKFVKKSNNPKKLEWLICPN